jgi:hypothetical protein
MLSSATLAAKTLRTMSTRPTPTALSSAVLQLQVDDVCVFKFARPHGRPGRENGAMLQRRLQPLVGQSLLSTTRSHIVWSAQHQVGQHQVTRSRGSSDLYHHQRRASKQHAPPESDQHGQTKGASTAAHSQCWTRKPFKCFVLLQRVSIQTSNDLVELHQDSDQTYQTCSVPLSLELITLLKVVVLSS